MMQKFAAIPPNAKNCLKIAESNLDVPLRSASENDLSRNARAHDDEQLCLNPIG